MVLDLDRRRPAAPRGVPRPEVDVLVRAVLARGGGADRGGDRQVDAALAQAACGGAAVSTGRDADGRVGAAVCDGVDGAFDARDADGEVGRAQLGRQVAREVADAQRERGAARGRAAVWADERDERRRGDVVRELRMVVEDATAAEAVMAAAGRAEATVVVAMVEVATVAEETVEEATVDATMAEATVAEAMAAAMAKATVAAMVEVATAEDGPTPSRPWASRASWSCRISLL